MLDLGFPLPSQTLRFVALEFKQELDPENPKYAGREKLSKNWERGFYKRHPHLKKRLPKKNSFAKGNGSYKRVLEEVL